MSTSRRVRGTVIAAAAAAAITVLAPASPAVAAAPTVPVAVRIATGDNAAAIKATVDKYRADLGGQANTNAGSAGSGRREINWDGVPDDRSAPNNLPADFFNTNVPRGAVFTTGGSGFQVSGNAGVAPIEFDNLNPKYSAQFGVFSPQRLFTAVDSRVLEVNFFVPGSTTPATVSGFGAVFTDVDRLGSKIEYFDRNGRRIGSLPVPPRPGAQTLSFLGVKFNGAPVAKVRITSGTVDPGRDEGGKADVVVMDDFLFGEPVA